MKLLALDFDGVISDSAREAYVVALRAWRELQPGAALDASAERDGELYERFLAAMPLGNRAEDFAVILAALVGDRPLPDQAAYDAFYAELDPGLLRHFHQRFYELRHAWCARAPEEWLALMHPYPRFCELLQRRASDVLLAIATAKDRRSVRGLLGSYGLAALFPDERVLDKETGVSKRSHIEHLARLFGLDFEEITFVDDKVNHLDSVASLGARCVLAAWGYNGGREQRLALRAGHLVCQLEDFEERVFGC